jgi:uncharacterized surface protein with fasciclin (FAS1) repeats
MAPTAAVIGFAAPLAMFLAGCNSSDDNTTTKNIAEIASGQKELTTLVAALAATNLTSAVADTKDITVFAPVNDAFDALPKEVLSCLLEPVGLSTLSQVLQYHVVPVEAKAADLTNDESLTTLDKKNLTVMLDGSTVTIKGGASSANVTEADIMATNGVVHEINAVLLPKGFEAPQCGNGTIAETAVATEPLSTLVAALTAADLVDTFNGSHVYTVFAPTNDAFTTLNTTTVPGILNCLLMKENKAALQQVLTYHVVDAYDLASDITDGLKVATLEKEDLTFMIKDKSVMIETTSNGTSTVVIPDVYATNGVVHVIDAVMIPADFKNPCDGASFAAEEAIMV